MRQVRMYVDGYNFYYAVKRLYGLEREQAGQKSLIGLGWCDFRRLGEHMIDRSSEAITEIKYFTARAAQDYPGHPGESQRQLTWLRAVNTISGLRTILGRLSDPRRSRSSGTDLKPDRTEKHTDINIAIEMLMDALDAKGNQKTILISADTDLAPAVYALQKGIVDRGLVRNGTSVDVWLTPGGSDHGWKAFFNDPEHRCPIRIKRIDEPMLAKSLLPYEKSQVYACPRFWRLPAAYLNEMVPEDLRPDTEIRASNATRISD